MSAFDYHTFVDGKGHRFTLPPLGIPDPQGEWVTIDAALTTDQLDSLDSLNRAKRKPLPRCMRAPSEDSVTIDVEHEGALWRLPMLQPVGKEETQAFTLRVLRLPPPGAEENASTSQLDPLTQAAGALSLDDASPSNASPSAPRLTSPGAFETASAARTLGLSLTSSISRASEDASSDVEEQNDPTSDSDSEFALLGPQPAPVPQPPLPPSIDPFGLLGNQRTFTPLDPDAYGPLSLNFRYKSNFNWTYKFDTTILHLQYQDELPKCGTIPGEHLQAHREAGGIWTIDFGRRTLYHKPAVQGHIRNKIWQDLLTVGLECSVSRKGIVSVNLGLPRPNRIKSPSPQLCPGTARIKAIPNGSNYTCQPSSASSEASYFLNRYHLLITQDSHSYPILCPLASHVSLNDELFLCLLGQAASATSTSARDPAAKMPYAQRPLQLLGVAELYNVGVRLRDGGARFPVISRGRNRKRLLMPGKALWYAWFVEDGDWETLKAHKEEKEKQKEVTIRMAVPPGQQDVVLRVREKPQQPQVLLRQLLLKEEEDEGEGAYNVLECAFRAHGSSQPIAEGEWQRVEAQVHMDGWAVEFLINLAKESVGYKKRVGLSEEEEEEE